MENMTQLEYVVRGVKRLMTSLHEQDFPSSWSFWDSCFKLGSQNWKKVMLGCCGLQQQCAFLGFCDQGKLSAQQTPALTLAFI